MCMMSDTMKIADLLGSRKRRVRVRVPMGLQEQLGATAKGTVEKLTRRDSVAWVQVRIRGALYEFRPQDLSLVG